VRFTNEVKVRAVYQSGDEAHFHGALWISSPASIPLAKRISSGNALA
jgi:hypothetical protein